MKKVSIVTPVYKVEKYIGDCIQSVINQTYPSIELVLVDDCGGDKSVDIINDYISSTQKEGLEIKLIHHSIIKALLLLVVMRCKLRQVIIYSV